MNKMAGNKIYNINMSSNYKLFNAYLFKCENILMYMKNSDKLNPMIRKTAVPMSLIVFIITAITTSKASLMMVVSVIQNLFFKTFNVVDSDRNTLLS